VRDEEEFIVLKPMNQIRSKKEVNIKLMRQSGNEVRQNNQAIKIIEPVYFFPFLSHFEQA